MELPQVETLVRELELLPHPEGGFYKENYRSIGSIPAAVLGPEIDGDRNYSTAIYYLLEQGDFSAFHRIRQDEIWHHYLGGPLLLHVIDPNGNYQAQWIGSDMSAGQRPQWVVKAGDWFAAEPDPSNPYSLMGCTVAPGFDFADFELAERSKMSQMFPQHQELIQRLTR